MCNRLDSSTGHFPGASAAYMKEQKKHFAKKKEPSFSTLEHDLSSGWKLNFQAKGGVQKQRAVLINEAIGLLFKDGELQAMLGRWGMSESKLPTPSQDVSRVHQYFGQGSCSWSYSCNQGGIECAR